MMVVLRGNTKKSFGCNVLRGVKGSVIRNKAKRRLRAIGRRHWALIGEGTQMFVLATPRGVAATFEELNQAFLVTAKNMGLLKSIPVL